MITLTIFAKSINIYTRSVYYYDAIGFESSDQKPNYRKIHNVIQSVEFFYCDYYLNTDFFQEFTFLKKVGDLVFIEFHFENEKEFAHFLRTNPIFNWQVLKRRTKDDENNIHYIFELKYVEIIYEYEKATLL